MVPRVSPLLLPLLLREVCGRGGDDGQRQSRPEPGLDDALPHLAGRLVEALVVLPNVVADPGVLKAEGGKLPLVLQQGGLEKSKLRFHFS